MEFFFFQKQDIEVGTGFFAKCILWFLIGQFYVESSNWL